MRLAAWSILLGGLVSLAACGNDDDGGDAPGAAGSGGGGTSTNGAGGEPADVSDTCREGCELTLAADCEKGPLDQASCETQCHALETGRCGAEYATLQSCAEGKTLTCVDGYPLVAECPDEQAAFVACLNG